MFLNCGVGEDSRESLDFKEIQPVHPKGDQPWVFPRKTDVEAETPILWPPDENRWLIWWDPDAGKDWGQEEMGMTEDEIVGWHHRLKWQPTPVFLPREPHRQQSLIVYSPRGRKESDTTERLHFHFHQLNGHECG